MWGRKAADLKPHQPDEMAELPKNVNSLRRSVFLCSKSLYNDLQLTVIIINIKSVRM